MPLPLTIVMITLNEAHNMAAVLDNLEGFAERSEIAPRGRNRVSGDHDDQTPDFPHSQQTLGSVTEDAPTARLAELLAPARTHTFSRGEQDRDRAAAGE